eukprot:356178-Chlamydomonas_euryale.AAC.2
MAPLPPDMAPLARHTPPRSLRKATIVSRLLAPCCAHNLRYPPPHHHHHTHTQPQPGPYPFSILLFPPLSPSVTGNMRQADRDRHTAPHPGHTPHTSVAPPTGPHAASPARPRAPCLRRRTAPCSRWSGPPRLRRTTPFPCNPCHRAAEG